MTILVTRTSVIYHHFSYLSQYLFILTESSRSQNNTTRERRFRERRAIFVRVIDDSHENVYFHEGEKKSLTKIYFREDFTWTVMKIFIFV